MKSLLAILFLALIVAGYLGFKAYIAGIDKRVGSLQNSNSLLRDLKRELSSMDGCLKLFASGQPLDLTPLTDPDGVIPVTLLHQGVRIQAGVQLTKENVTVEDLSLANLVDLGPFEEKRGFQGRLKLKVAATAKEHMVALVKITTDANGHVIACVSSEDSGFANTGKRCRADNSPDQMRAGGAANIVAAPEGTMAVSGKMAQPVFAFDGVVKWLPSPACGPVNYCLNGLWTTTATIPCKD